MNLALHLAKGAAAQGEVPVGAVIVGDGTLLGWGANCRHAHGDVLGHAEIVALRAAANALKDWRIERSTVYVTLEPCIMCTGALLQARVARLVFACRDPKAGAVRSLFALGDDPRLPFRMQITEGLLGDESRHLLQSFFENLRKKRQ